MADPATLSTATLSSLAAESSVSVELALGGPAADVVGTAWPRNDRGEVEAALFLPRGANIVVRFPNLHCWRTPSRAFYAGQRDGVVSAVEITPLPRLVPYNEALRALERAADELGVADDASLGAVLLAWYREPPEEGARGADRSVAATHASGVSLSFTLAPHPAGRGWYLTVSCFLHPSVQ